MKYLAFVVTASIVIAFHMQNTVHGFQFSLPGQWGNNARKRTFSFSLPGQWGNGGKRSFLGSGHQCESTDMDTLQAVYNLLQAETERVKLCMEYISSLSNKLENKP